MDFWFIIICWLIHPSTCTFPDTSTGVKEVSGYYGVGYWQTLIALAKITNDAKLKD